MAGITFINEQETVKSYFEKIQCPECDKIQLAEVKESHPFTIYIHDCESCGYVITESDWNIVEEKFN